MLRLLYLKYIFPFLIRRKNRLYGLFLLKRHAKKNVIAAPCEVYKTLRNIGDRHYSSQIKKQVFLDENITVQDLANDLNVGVNTILNILKEYEYPTDQGIKTVLDRDISELLADEFGYSLVSKNDDGRLLLPRPAVVTIMGHVDHGKTTLLDYLRKSSIAANEPGGITQSIGAFSVTVPGLNDRVTFVDTPGHAAFNSMRARGAQLTDIVVLVIAADDGIMQQTVECLKHVKEAEVPMIVAINKIDKPKANPNRIKKELLSNGIQLEEFGGDVKCICISALKGTNIGDLLVLLNDFSKESKLTASFNGPVEAVILEAESNKQKGIISSLLIKEGLLKKGTVLLAGSAHAKARQLFDANGKVLTSAGPSEPVQVLGWRSLPTPGEVAVEIESETEAKNILKLQAQDAKPAKTVVYPSQKPIGKSTVSSEFKSGRSKRIPYRVSLRADASMGVDKENVDENAQKTLNVIIKADVSGSLEVIVNVLAAYHSTDIKLNILEASVGSVTETDIKLAQTFDGLVYSFNSVPAKGIMNLANQMDVSLRHFNVIYKLLDDLKEELELRLPYQTNENVIGEAEVLQVFKLTGARKSIAAGCHVNDGLLDNTDKSYVWKVVRDKEVVHEGSLKTLKRGMEDIATAKMFTECGIVLNNFEDFQKGDRIQCTKVHKIKQVVDWNL